jgi:energy-coupling factor transport system ATP-binding protein
LSFSYRKARQAEKFAEESAEGPSLNALDNVSIDIKAGEYITLLGENGSGKSTLISCVNGLLAPPPGAIAVFTPEGVQLDPANKAHLERIRSLTGMTLQNPDLQIIGCAVEEDVAFGPENLNLSKAEIQSRVTNALRAVELLHLRDRAPHLLSGGEKQRLALAGILALDASILIFDEPTSMLDSHSAQTILALFDTLNSQGRTIIHITHNHDEALRSGRSIVLREGKVAFDGVPEAWGELEEWRLGYARKSAGFSGFSSNSSQPSAQFFSASHHYPHPAARSITGIQGVSLRIPRNSTTAVVGKSGCGKTTLLKHINALLLPSSGNVVTLGADTLDKRVNLRSLRFKAALAIQSPESALFEPYVADDVAFGPENAGLKGAKLVQRVKTAMEASGLPFSAFADRETTSLSGGEKRRAALAGALAMDSEILLLDEPLAALDNKNKRRVMELIFEQQAKGKTILVTTHSLEMAAFFDYVAVMDNGRLAAFGPPEAVFGELWNPDWGLAAPKFQNAPPDTTHPVRQSDAPPAPLKSPVQSKHRRKTGKPLFKTAFLGRFLDIDSPLRNLNPLVKMTALFAAGTISIAGSLYAPPVVLLIVLLSGKLLGKIACKTLLRSVVAILPFLLVFVFLQTAFLWGNDASPILFQPFQTGFFSFFSITSAELHRSLAFICRITSLIAAFSLYLAATPLRETLSAINTLLSPLSRLGLPARDIAMMVGISIRFVPLLTEEAERIVTAQISRGGKRGLRSSLAMLVPLLLLSLERAETLANAMLLRLYKTGA